MVYYPPIPLKNGGVSHGEKRNQDRGPKPQGLSLNYFVEDRYEAGVELFGTEVKSIRAGTLNLKDAYCTIKGGELFVHGMHISPYEKGNIFNKDPVRTRRLLMHKREIRKLQALVQKDGYTLVPLSVYFRDARGEAGDPASARARRTTISGPLPPGRVPIGKWTAP